MVTALLILNTVLLLVLIFLLKVTSFYLLGKIEGLVTNQDLPIAKVNKNQVAQPTDQMATQFSEDNPIRLDKNAKYEIEGGDSVIPPEYA